MILALLASSKRTAPSSKRTARPSFGIPLRQVVEEEKRLTLLQFHGDVAPLAKVQYKDGAIKVEYDCSGHCDGSGGKLGSVDLGAIFSVKVTAAI